MQIYNGGGAGLVRTQQIILATVEFYRVTCSNKFKARKRLLQVADDKPMKIHGEPYMYLGQGYNK